ncbi:prepilin-type N-terminal cleavage/methylation domain-containing protein [Thioflavicoccus mobilis 8321]|uniref:Prepilin-type N-terminal cleavage/methylation domain-containing protein n=1 Tax=Thioflavicoccus mobilis 8321 TaxID=765912 RepID=L0GVV9_9GAMM|nr:prepilin-type N-terminal cleavage/methylation domain-containing protein [Thioflavicoccus mobilis]AGA89485.1 prepilin-type N-terminal cleavage/methylation domain-containing protein [Thioflavicoccus mobilis 8321]
MTQPPTATPRTPPRRPQQGMTLLELLVVIALMSVVGFMALSQVGDDLNQARYEDTRNRLEMIRKAIIGDTSRTLNGQPEIRGFVADMGRLPANLQELIEREFCSNPVLGQAACTGAETWTSMPAYAHDATAGLWAGWNGPYLNASPESDYPRFRDGWGNDNGSNDFGWVFNDSGGAGPLLVQSTGMDGTAGGSDYDADYPPTGSETLIEDGQWRVTVTDSLGAGGIQIDFGAPASCWRCSDGLSTDRTTCEFSDDWYPDSTIPDAAACTALGGAAWRPTDNLCLRLLRRQNGTFDTNGDSTVDTADALESNGAVSVTWDGSRKVETFVFASGTFVPQGVSLVRVYTHDGVATCETTEFPSGQDSLAVALIPGVATLPLPWPVQ